MTWLKIDDGLMENGKVEKLSDRAFRLHIAALCHCARNLTDGVLSPRAQRILYATVNATAKHAGELVDAGLWFVATEGHRIKDYLEYNPSAEEVKQQRARNAARQADLRKRRNEARDEIHNSLGNGVSNGVTNGVSNAAPSPTPAFKPPKVVSSTPALGEINTYSGERTARMQRLLDACKLYGTDAAEAEIKLFRALRHSTEADVQAAIDAANRPCRDRLSVVLSTLKKRKESAA